MGSPYVHPGLTVVDVSDREREQPLVTAVRSTGYRVQHRCTVPYVRGRARATTGRSAAIAARKKGNVGPDEPYPWIHVMYGKRRVKKRRTRCTFSWPRRPPTSCEEPEGVKSLKMTVGGEAGGVWCRTGHGLDCEIV